MKFPIEVSIRKIGDNLDSPDATMEKRYEGAITICLTQQLRFTLVVAASRCGGIENARNMAEIREALRLSIYKDSETKAVELNDQLFIVILWIITTPLGLTEGGMAGLLDFARLLHGKAEDWCNLKFCPRTNITPIITKASLTMDYLLSSEAVAMINEAFGFGLPTEEKPEPEAATSPT